MTDRKPALVKHRFVGVEGRIHCDRTLFYPATFPERELVLASDIPPAILNADAETLNRCAALAAMSYETQRAVMVFAEAMPHWLGLGVYRLPDSALKAAWESACYAAAKSTTAEEA